MRGGWRRRSPKPPPPHVFRRARPRPVPWPAGAPRCRRPACPHRLAFRVPALRPACPLPSPEPRPRRSAPPSSDRPPPAPGDLGRSPVRPLPNRPVTSPQPGDCDFSRAAGLRLPLSPQPLQRKTPGPPSHPVPGSGAQTPVRPLHRSAPTPTCCSPSAPAPRPYLSPKSPGSRHGVPRVRVHCQAGKGHSGLALEPQTTSSVVCESHFG